MTDFKRRRGFTLVELSIVLVILGLLVGGVLSGQSLIRASELRAVTSENQRYVTAVNAFRDKYFAIPGDMTNASSFWTTLAAANNGNGDGIIPYGTSAASTTGETYQFWNELSLAGLIEGKYTGLSGPVAGGADHVPGSNCPKSKISGAGWTAYTFGVFGGNFVNYAADYGMIFGFGATVSGGSPYGANLKPEEAWNIDTKQDDGNPSSGKVIAHEATGWGGASSTKCTTSTGSSDYTGTYNLSNTNLTCGIYFAKVF